MTDTSFMTAGHAVLIEDVPLEKFTSNRKTFAPVAYGSQTFSPTELKMSISAKEFSAIFFAFKKFGHIFWGTPKLVTIQSNNKSVTRFFQTYRTSAVGTERREEITNTNSFNGGWNKKVFSTDRNYVDVAGKTKEK